MQIVGRIFTFRLLFFVSTIDKFQGGGKDEIFISCARSNDGSQIGFLNDPRRLHVAISRAKALCIVVGDCKHCYDSDNSGLLWELAEYCDKQKLNLDYADSYQVVSSSGISMRCRVRHEYLVGGQAHKKQINLCG